MKDAAAALASPTRLELLRHVASVPGITQSQLSARIPGVSPRYARYHLERLRRAGLIDVFSHGRAHTYMLKGGGATLGSRPPSAEPAEAAQAQGNAPSGVPASVLLAELNHPHRRLIFEALRDTGPSHYLQLLRTWESSGAPRPYPSRPDVSHQGARLERAGIVGRRRRGRHTIWFLRIDPEEARRIETLRYVPAPHFKALYDAARRSSLVAAGPRGSETPYENAPRTVDEIVEFLEEAGQELRRRPPRWDRRRSNWPSATP